MFQEISENLEAFLSTGDPVVSSWFLMNSKFWPIFLCSLYLLVVKIFGPAYMKYRKPYKLRREMIIFNVGLVVLYVSFLIWAIYCFTQVDPRASFCGYNDYSPGTALHNLAICAWMFYILKYVEFLDTIFFVLRKKDHLVTNLHVIHHFMMPMCCWIVGRSDRTGFIVVPIVLNAVVHIIMYSYYALAAMGPGVRKYLWWKKYLTMIQMIQFVIIVFSFIILRPYMGCPTVQSSKYLIIGLNVIFLALFYNYYTQTFKRKQEVDIHPRGDGGKSKIKNS